MYNILGILIELKIIKNLIVIKKFRLSTYTDFITKT